MQKFIKNNLKVVAAFILGIVVSGISVYASGISFASGDVAHTKANGTTTTVESAINELYSIHTSGNATTGDILTGKTAFSNGQLLTGTMNDYSSSIAQTCTKANTSNELYVKPVNSGYYTANSSFNTGINYNPKGVGGTAATSGTTVTTSSTNVTLNNSNLILEAGTKITIPAGYYSDTINVSSGNVALSETVLWTNSSPTVTFAAQDVPLSDSINNYKYLKVYSRVSTSGDNDGSMLIPLDEFQTETNNMVGWMITAKDTSAWYERIIIKVNDTTVRIAAATKRNATGIFNNNTIPIKICGLK